MQACLSDDGEGGVGDAAVGGGLAASLLYSQPPANLAHACTTSYACSYLVLSYVLSRLLSMGSHD